jgi:hypothetical protein
LRFRGRDLFTEADTKPDKLSTFDLKPSEDPSMFIKAKSILIRPGVEVKIKHASFYVQGSKVPSVPLYVIKLRGQGAGSGQMLNYGSDGLELNMPFYYSLTPTTTGSIRLKHSEPTGWGYYSGSPGWELDLNHEYSGGGAGDGLFSFDHFTSASEWGMSWNQRKEFGNQGQLTSYLDFPEHRSLYSTLDYSQPLGNYTLSWDFRGSKVQATDANLSSGIYLQSHARPLIGKAVSYSFNTRVSYANQFVGEGVSNLGTGAGIQLYGKPVQFNPVTSLSTSLIASHDIGGAQAGSTVYANAV